MKRIIICCVLLSLISSTAYAKKFDNSVPTKEIEFLNSQDIIVGDPDGNLRESDEITRAEFVTILCRAIGIEDLATSDEMKSKEIYEDVPSSHWASGYINAATECGAINGMGDGLFCPEEPVTNEQAIKILVAAWGYTSDAEAAGGYPNGYMEVAQKFGVTDSVLFNYGLASKRWVVSVFTYNMLSVEPKVNSIKNALYERLYGTYDIITEERNIYNSKENICESSKNIFADNHIMVDLNSEKSNLKTWISELIPLKYRKQ